MTVSEASDEPFDVDTPSAFAGGGGTALGTVVVVKPKNLCAKTTGAELEGVVSVSVVPKVDYFAFSDEAVMTVDGMVAC